MTSRIANPDDEDLLAGTGDGTRSGVEFDMPRAAAKIDSIPCLQPAQLHIGDQCLATRWHAGRMDEIGPLRVVKFYRRGRKMLMDGVDTAGRLHTLMIRGQAYNDPTTSLAVEPFTVTKLPAPDAGARPATQRPAALHQLRSSLRTVRTP